jgi:hypothetical protein
MQTVNHIVNTKGWQMNNQLAFTSFNGANDKGTVFRPVIDINKQFKKINNWRIGMRYALEETNPGIRSTDTLTPLTFSFDILSAYLKSGENKKK